MAKWKRRGLQNLYAWVRFPSAPPEQIRLGGGIGIRTGLKILGQKWIEGSSPSPGTIKTALISCFLFTCYALFSNNFALYNVYIDRALTLNIWKIITNQPF